MTVTNSEISWRYYSQQNCSVGIWFECHRLRKTISSLIPMHQPESFTLYTNRAMHCEE